jgi:hypothetical protein
MYFLSKGPNVTRILIAALSLSVLGYLGYRAMYGDSANLKNPELSGQSLQEMRAKAKELEEKGRQHVQEVDDKTKE